jgi:hypothetical protein
VTSNVFLKGHRIRVEISSSNFPRFDRNPNTGGRSIADERVLKTAQQTVYHSAPFPSHLLLPVISEGGRKDLTSPSVARYGAKGNQTSPAKSLTFQAR